MNKIEGPKSLSVDNIAEYVVESRVLTLRDVSLCAFCPHCGRIKRKIEKLELPGDFSNSAHNYSGKNT